jgi:outer membrane protein assembly factor BamB
MPNWLRGRTALLISGIVVPPVGLILLWLRPIRWYTKIAGSLGILTLLGAHLVCVFGLRVELAGSGMRPIFTFGTPERHYARLEESRVIHKQEAPQTEAQTAPASAENSSLTAAPATPAAPKPKAWWTDFRGPARDGVYPGEILTEWPDAGLERLWKQPVGGGYASFVFGEGRAFTIEQRRENEVVAAYDLRTGREWWTHSYRALFQENLGGDGPRATPTYHDGLVYSLGATGEMRVLDARTGAVKWSKNIVTENGGSNIQWGMCGSPLIVDGKVIVQPGGPSGKSIVAYDKETGKLIWGSLDDRQAYTSPMLVTLAGKRQILTVTATRAVGLTVEDGKPLWEYPWTTEFDINSAQPIVIGENRFLISAGYGHGAALVEVTPAGGAYKAKTIWQNTRLKNRFNSSVLYEGHVYGLDENILACVRVSDGALMWKGGRYGYGQVLLASGHLVVITESGELALVKATPQSHIEVAKFDAIDGKTWNVPAIENGMLLVRNAREMACFRIGKS